MAGPVQVGKIDLLLRETLQPKALLKRSPKAEALKEPTKAEALRRLRPPRSHSHSGKNYR
jgi:hypothetical protein